jgi:asparagine synthase (glutamine-hydrolysing)
MCGIAGVLRLDGEPASAALARSMADAMPHRGPDGRGAWADGPVALAHARLIVRDASPAAAQPAVAPEGAGVLVYNGEVYDDRELRAELEREGVVFRGTGDTEVVLHAIARWGIEAALPRLDGMFALAWWDARRRALHLARDRFGTKPLHVAVSDRRVAFASEVRGLRPALGPLRPDLVEVVRRLFPAQVHELRPPFEGIENVAPGERWTVEDGRVRRTSWCDLAASIDLGRLAAAEREPAGEREARVEATVERAVREHLASDVPVAAFTSGGVDSNLVASIAHEERKDLVAYTVDTGDPESEIEEARAAASHAGFALKRVAVDRETWMRAWPAAVEALEHPPSHPSLPAVLVLARAARADGAVVALTGEGSDELFGGYDFFERTRHRRRQATRPWSRWTHRGRAALRDLEDVPFRYQSIRAERDTHLRFAATVAPSEESRAREIMARLAPVEPPHDRAFLGHSLDALRRHLGWILLRHDRMGMAASLEARVPFLSNRVADVALHLPVSAKIRGRVAKWTLKRVAARRLPPRVVFARKKGFPIPGSHHEGTAAFLRGGVVASLLRWDATAEADLVPRIARDPIARPQFVGLELWGRLFLRGERAEALAEALLALPAR